METDGRLKAVRIGRQYRIAREDLEAFMGGAAEPAAEAAGRRHVEASRGSVPDLSGRARAAQPGEQFTQQVGELIATFG